MQVLAPSLIFISLEKQKDRERAREFPFAGSFPKCQLTARLFATGVARTETVEPASDVFQGVHQQSDEVEAE